MKHSDHWQLLLQLCERLRAITKSYQQQSSELQCKLALLIRAKNVAHDKPACVRVTLLALLQMFHTSGCSCSWSSPQVAHWIFILGLARKACRSNSSSNGLNARGGSMVLKFNVDVELMADLAQAFFVYSPPLSQKLWASCPR